VSLPQLGAADPLVFPTVADDMYAALARDGSSRGRQAEIDALVDDLLPGYRRSTAA